LNLALRYTRTVEREREERERLEREMEEIGGRVKDWIGRSVVETED
jgi:hypothetical protein